jgi:hypothetical protein
MKALKSLGFLGVAVLGGILMAIVDDLFHVEFTKNVSPIARLAHDVVRIMMGMTLYAIVNAKKKGSDQHAA